MHYNYRWVYLPGLFLGVFLLGYLCVLRNDFNLLSFSQVQEQELQASLIKIETAKSLKPLIANNKTPEFLPDLMRLLDTSHLVAQTINVKPIAGELKGMKVEITIEGSFENFLTFSAALHQRPYSAFILDFAGKLANERNLFMTVTILHLANDLTPSLSLQNKFFSNLPLSNPFCHESTAIKLEQEARLYPIKQMHLVGFLSTGLEVFAFVQLPNKQVVKVVQGAVLGNDHGRVSTITSQHIVFVMPDKQQVVLDINQ